MSLLCPSALLRVEKNKIYFQRSISFLPFLSFVINRKVCADLLVSLHLLRCAGLVMSYTVWNVMLDIKHSTSPKKNAIPVMIQTQALFLTILYLIGWNKCNFIFGKVLLLYCSSSEAALEVFYSNSWWLNMGTFTFNNVMFCLCTLRVTFKTFRTV